VNDGGGNGTGSFVIEIRDMVGCSEVDGCASSRIQTELISVFIKNEAKVTGKVNRSLF